MNIRFWSGVLFVLLVAGCGSSGTPTRDNDITPLTSITIEAVPSIAAGTSTRLKAIGNFSGFFTRDITSQVTWSSDTPGVAAFSTAADPRRVTSSSSAAGTAALKATSGALSATVNLSVTSATVSTMTISPPDPTVPTGLNRQFTVSGLFSDGTTQDLTLDSVWLSSNPAVASISSSVNSEGLAKALAVGTTDISASFGGVITTRSLTVTAPTVQSITVTPATPSLLSISRGTFKAVGLFSDGSTSEITSQAAWSSSATTVATAAGNGVVSTLVPGTTSISASLSGISGSTSLRVTGGSLTGITLSQTNPTLVQGTHARIAATGTFSNSTTRDISGAVTWTVDNTTFATISPPNGNLVQISALSSTPAQAPTIITAASGSINAKTNLTVSNPTPVSLAITPASQELPVGASTRLTVTGSFSDGTTQDLTDDATWISGASASATVGDSGITKGRVTGISANATPVTITATFRDKTAPDITVTIRQRTLQSLTITRSSTAVTAGTQLQFTITANYGDGSTQNVTEDAQLSIDNSNVASRADSLNFPGRVWLVDAGSATLTASFGGRTQTAAITVP